MIVISELELKELDKRTLMRLQRSKPLQKTIKSWIRNQMIMFGALVLILIVIVLAIAGLTIFSILNLVTSMEYIVSVIAILFALALFVLGAFYVIIRLYSNIKEFELPTKLAENNE